MTHRNPIRAQYDAANLRRRAEFAREGIRLPLNVERDLVWGDWPEEADLEEWEEEGLTVSNMPYQPVMDCK